MKRWLSPVGILSLIHIYMISQFDKTLEARELIKVKILQNSSEEVKDAGAKLAQALNAELVQTIGHCLVLYRKSATKPKIELPK